MSERRQILQGRLQGRQCWRWRNWQQRWHMQRMRRQQSSRLCAPVAPAARFQLMATETTSSSWRGRQRKNRRRSGQPRTPRGTVATTQTGADAPVALWAGARGGRAPDDGGNPDRRGRTDGWVDGNHGLYRRRGSPSPDRYHGYHGIQTIVRDVGPDGGWPTLTKINYVEWAAVMRVRLQVRHMWEVVRYGDVDYYEDQRALNALIAAVPSEMQFSLSQKRTVKEA
jgi:hypothetical protein